MRSLLVTVTLCCLATSQAANQTRVLILGDSWGTISPATEHFQAKLKEHSCAMDGFTNIAVGGTTAKQWAGGLEMIKVKNNAKTHDLIWITLMGNDALEECGTCASKGKSAEECGDELMVNVIGYMETILDGIHEANPEAQVVGFGYDTMFGGFGCGLISHSIFPQCWKNKTAYPNPTRCFNTQLIRIQGAWETLAANRTYVTAINILGTTQHAGGVANATVGSPNLDFMGPSKYWPITLQCFHPSTSGGDASGAMIIMEEFYKQYWSKALGC